MRVRLVPNEPDQGLAFWAEALLSATSSSPATPRCARGTFDAPAGKGLLNQWVAPVGGENWIDPTGIAVAGDSIAIARRPGPTTPTRPTGGAIVASLATLTVH